METSTTTTTRSCSATFLSSSHHGFVIVAMTLPVNRVECFARKSHLKYLLIHDRASVYAAKCYQELKATDIYGNVSKYKFQFLQA